MDSISKEINYVVDGLASAVTCTECMSLKSQKAHQKAGQNILYVLENKNSRINQLFPEVHRETEPQVMRAIDTFPTEDSINSLLYLLRTYSRLNVRPKRTATSASKDS